MRRAATSRPITQQSKTTVVTTRRASDSRTGRARWLLEKRSLGAPQTESLTSGCFRASRLFLMNVVNPERPPNPMIISGATRAVARTPRVHDRGAVRFGEAPPDSERPSLEEPGEADQPSVGGEAALTDCIAGDEQRREHERVGLTEEQADRHRPKVQYRHRTEREKNWTAPGTQVSCRHERPDSDCERSDLGCCPHLPDPHSRDVHERCQRECQGRRVHEVVHAVGSSAGGYSASGCEPVEKVDANASSYGCVISLDAEEHQNCDRRAPRQWSDGTFERREDAGSYPPRAFGVKASIRMRNA